MSEAPRRIRLRPRESGLGKQIALSVALGVLVWAAINISQSDQVMVEVPVRLDLPAGWQLESGMIPDRVSVRLSGPRTVVSGLVQEEMPLVHAIEIPSAFRDKALFPKTVEFSAADLQGVPSDVFVSFPKPLRFDLQLERLVEKYVDVSVTLTGTPREGFQVVGRPRAEPAQVPVLLPDSLWNASLEVETEPFDISGADFLQANYVFTRNLLIQGRIIPVRHSVYVTVNIDEKPIERLVENIPVRVMLSTPAKLGRWRLEPPTVSVKLVGLPKAVEATQPNQIRIHVDTADLGPNREGGQALPLHAFPIKGLQSVQPEVETVRWIHLPDEPEGGTP